MSALTEGPTIRPLLTTAIWVAYTALLWWLYAGLPVNPDQEMFDYIGWVGANGGSFYQDASDHNWPGVMLLHELAMRIFGSHAWSFRVFDYVLMLCGAFSLGALLYHARMTLAAWIVVPMYQLMYATSGEWFAGQRDVIAAHFLLVAAVSFVTGLKRSQYRWLFVSGLLCGYATLIRPTYTSYVAGLALLTLLGPYLSGITFMVRRELARVMILLSGWLLVVASAILWGYLNGVLDDWYQHAWLFNFHISFDTRHNSIIDTLIRLSAMHTSWHWYLAFSVLGFVVWIRQQGISLLFLACMGIAGTGLLSAIVQKAGFGYHLGALFPVMAALIAVLLSRSFLWWRGNPKNLLAAGITFTLLLVAAGGFGSKVWSYEPQVTAAVTGTEYAGLNPNYRFQKQRHEVAAFIIEHTDPEDYVLVWSRNVHVNLLAKRQSPTRFTNIGMLTNMTESFEHYEDWQAIFEADLQTRRPRIIVANHPSASDGFDRLFTDEVGNTVLKNVRELVKNHYNKVYSAGSLDVYMLSPTP